MNDKIISKREKEEPILRYKYKKDLQRIIKGKHISKKQFEGLLKRFS
jgi:hypothetical protein